jgi:single-stranded-DNA-specific exonuclease
VIIIKPKQISNQFNLNPIVAEILYKRGYNEDWEIEQFLNPTLDNLSSPSVIPNIEEIGDKIMKYVEFRDQITIMGDFDSDGVCSSTILYKSLKKLNANVDTLIGNRFHDGYGLSKRLIDKAKDMGTELIITVDMGISEHENIRYANNNGMEVIVFDHHEKDNPPNCDYIDLKVESGYYPFKYLSAAGLVWQICKYFDESYDLLDFATISTIGDLVPLYGENRMIVNEGLSAITNTNNIGLQALKKELGIEDKEITVGDVGFKISPCINARGRLYDNQKSFELFTTNDKDKANRLAKKLYNANEERKQMQKEGFESIVDTVNHDENFIIGKGNFGKGVVGLIAQDLKEKYDKPSLVFGGKGKLLKGSGRGMKPLHILNEMKKHEDLFENLGGHKMAFGCSIKEKNYDQLKEKILESTKNIEYKIINYDMKLDTDKINISLIEQLEVFQPCGMGNPSPKFLIEGTTTNITTVGKTNDHYKFNLNGIDCIAFDMADESLSNKFIGSLDINEWNMQINPQIIIRKIL